jgi:uncharacterized protein YbaR (Trm112 family)
MKAARAARFSEEQDSAMSDDKQQNEASGNQTSGDGMNGAGGEAPRAASGVDTRVLDLLVCPITKTRLAYRADTAELISRAAGLAFPIRDGVPLLIVEAARELGDADLK